MLSRDPKPKDAAANGRESQEDLTRRKLALEHARKLNKEKKEAQLVEAWESFVEEEARELQARRDGQLARMLGEPLPGEPPEALRQLAREDRRQAEEGLVTLMSGTKAHFKHIDELTQEDMPARTAAKTMRTTWLKERRDGWLANNKGSFYS